MRWPMIALLIFSLLLSWAALSQYFAASNWATGDWLIDLDRTRQETASTAKESPNDPAPAQLLEKLSKFPRMELLISDHDITSLNSVSDYSFEFTVVRRTTDDFFVKSSNGQIEHYARDGDELYFVVPINNLKCYFKRKP